jgi:hypothetical protein
VFGVVGQLGAITGDLRWGVWLEREMEGGTPRPRLMGSYDWVDVGRSWTGLLVGHCLLCNMQSYSDLNYGPTHAGIWQGSEPVQGRVGASFPLNMLAGFGARLPMLAGFGARLPMLAGFGARRKSP